MKEETEREVSDSARRPGVWSFLFRFKGRLLASTCCAMVAAVCVLLVPMKISELITSLSGDSAMSVAPDLAGTIALLALGAVLGEVASHFFSVQTSKCAANALGTVLFRKLFSQPHSYYRENSVGDLVSRVTNDIDTIWISCWSIVTPLAKNVTLLLVGIALMYRIDPWMTIYACLQYPVLLTIGKLLSKRVFRKSAAVQEHLGRVASTVQEDLAGIETIRSYGLEQNRVGRFQASSGNLRTLEIAQLTANGLVAPALDVVLAFGGTFVVFLVGGQRVIDGAMPLGQLIEFDLYLAILAWPFLYLGMVLSHVQRGRASWERVADILVREVRDTGSDLTLPSGGADVVLDDVGVEIEGTNILSNVRFHVPAGRTTALVGATGAGKSTVLRVLAGIQEYSEGRAEIAGTPIEECTESSLCQCVGIAHQTPMLLSGTLRDTIVAGILHGGGATTDAEVVRYAELAGLSLELEGLPDGLDTQVGEGGSALSGGQRQRAALARTLAAEPPILLLDDPLASVDANTRESMLERLRRYMDGRTVVFASSQPKLLAFAEQIVVMDEGKVVDVGRHDELAARCPVYLELCAEDVA